MYQLADDHKVLAEFFPFFRKNKISTMIEFFCGSGNFVKLLDLGGFVASGTEPDVAIAAEVQRDGASVFPYSLSDLYKFEDGQFDGAGMVRIDRLPDDQAVDFIVKAGMQIGSRIFFYSVKETSRARKILGLFDKSKVSIFARSHEQIQGIVCLKI